MEHLPAFNISKHEEVFVEIAQLYHCDHNKKCWNKEFNEQFTGLEYLQTYIFLSGRKVKGSAMRKTSSPQKFPSQGTYVNVYKKITMLWMV